MKMKEYVTIVVVAIVGIVLLKNVLASVKVPFVSELVQSV